MKVVLIVILVKLVIIWIQLQSLVFNAKHSVPLVLHNLLAKNVFLDTISILLIITVKNAAYSIVFNAYQPLNAFNVQRELSLILLSLQLLIKRA